MNQTTTNLQLKKSLGLTCMDSITYECHRDDMIQIKATNSCYLSEHQGQTFDAIIQSEAQLPN